MSEPLLGDIKDQDHTRRQLLAIVLSEIKTPIESVLGHAKIIEKRLQEGEISHAELADLVSHIIQGASTVKQLREEIFELASKAID